MVANARCVARRTSFILIMTCLGQRAERLLPKRTFNFFARGTIWKNAIESCEYQLGTADTRQEARARLICNLQSLLLSLSCFYASSRQVPRFCFRRSPQSRASTHGDEASSQVGPMVF